MTTGVSTVAALAADDRGTLGGSGQQQGGRQTARQTRKPEPERQRPGAGMSADRATAGAAGRRRSRQVQYLCGGAFLVGRRGGRRIRLPARTAGRLLAAPGGRGGQAGRRRTMRRRRRCGRRRRHHGPFAHGEGAARRRCRGGGRGRCGRIDEPTRRGRSLRSPAAASERRRRGRGARRPGNPSGSAMPNIDRKSSATAAPDAGGWRPCSGPAPARRRNRSARPNPLRAG